jgi:hypothetical protein
MGFFDVPGFDMDTRPAWLRIAGADPNRRGLPLTERRAAFRKLLAEVERLARIELALAHEDGPGERTFLWDLVASICNDLEISRVALSRMLWQFSGMRAHEVTDRLKARLLPRQLKERLQGRFSMIKDILADLALGNGDNPEDLRSAETFDRCARKARALLRAERSGSAAMHFAAELGYANVSRVQRACTLAHGISLNQLEECLIDDMVQKFLDELHAEVTGEAQPKTETDAPEIKQPFLPENDHLAVFESSKQLADRWLAKLQRLEQPKEQAEEVA